MSSPAVLSALACVDITGWEPEGCQARTLAAIRPYVSSDPTHISTRARGYHRVSGGAPAWQRTPLFRTHENLIRAGWEVIGTGPCGSVRYGIPGREISVSRYGKVQE